MRKYLTVMWISFLDAMEYRTELFVRIAGWGIRLVISLFLWYAVSKASGGTVGPYKFQDMVVYFFLVQIMASFVFNDSGFEINKDIQYGDFSNYLVKPIKYLPFRFVTEFSYNVVRSLFGVVLFGTILAIVKPEFFAALAQEPSRLILFGVSLCLSMLINFHVIALLAMLAFWIVSAHRLLFVYFGIINIFSGLIMPLDLFPGPIFNILRFTPFPYIFYFPLSIMVKPITAMEYMGSTILPQITVIAILMTLLTFFYSIGLKRYEAVGR